MKKTLILQLYQQNLFEEVKLRGQIMENNFSKNILYLILSYITTSRENLITSSNNSNLLYYIEVMYFLYIDVMDLDIFERTSLHFS